MRNLVEDWLNSVSYSHSQSKATEVQYKRVWERYSAYIGMSPEEIVSDYERSDDRNVLRKHAQLIRSWIGGLAKEGLTNTSIKVMVGAIKSFYKYNDLPLGHIPQARSGVIFHNRDITKEEIVYVMAVSKIREKAFFAVMSQSGLRPHTIKQLKLRNLESLEKIPCKIEVQSEIAKGKFGSYVTFIGPDAIKYLKQYLATRTNLTPDSLLFCSHDDPNKPISVKAMSRAFRLSARKLEESGALDYEIREGKPSELRLYNLRKFFRKYANQMGFENVSYLMGHTVRGSDANYKPQDPEFYRELYVEKAMPFLRLETSSPLETEKAITTLEQENRELRDQIKGLESMMQRIYDRVFAEKIEEEAIEKLLDENSENDGQIEETIRKDEEYLAKHPEERKRREEEERRFEEDYEKYVEDNKEKFEAQEKWIEEESIRLDERRKTLQELQDILNKAKESRTTPTDNKGR